MRRPIVTKRSTANANTEKASSRQQCHSGISTSPKPCCESLRQQHRNNSTQHGALAKTGEMQAELETFNQQPCSPESCHPLHLQKSNNLIFGAIKTLAFGLQEVVLPSCVKACCLNLIYLLFRAGRKVPHCQKWDCHAPPLSAFAPFRGCFQFLF